MIFSKSTISVAFSLFALTTALPTSQSSTLTTRDDTQCKAGTNFYVCYKNNFRGCCSVDPCALDAGCPDQKPTPTPTPIPLPTPKPVCKEGKAKVYQPKMQVIEAGTKPVSTSNVDLFKSTTEERYQKMTFTVPADAKACSVWWSVPEDRKFTAGSNATVGVWEGTDTTNDRIGMADFTNWPGVEGPHTHTVGPADCKEKMEFTTKLMTTASELGKQEEKETHVSLEQNEETGWYVQYDCEE